MPFQTLGLLKINYQASPDRLVSSEQFQLGGAYTVRGYKEGALIGTSGLITNAEWYWPCPFIPKSLRIPFSGESVRAGTQLVGFVDFGANWVNKPVNRAERSDYLLSTGLGLRVHLTKHLTGRLDLGIPLLRQGRNTLNPRLHFGLQSELF